MKYLVKIFVVTFFVLICTHSFAEQKVVVLDLKYVLNNSKAGKGAQDFLKKSFNDNAKKFNDMEKKLKKEESDLLSKKAELTREDYTKKSDALRKKVIDYQSQRRASLDKIATQRATSREALINKINPAENGVSFTVINKGKNVNIFFCMDNNLIFFTKVLKY